MSANNGSNVTLVTHNNYDDGEPAWSPADSNYIAYTSRYQFTNTPNVILGGKIPIPTIADPSGNWIQRVIPALQVIKFGTSGNPNTVLFEYPNACEPAWSQNGTTISFTHIIDGDPTAQPPLPNIGWPALKRMTFSPNDPNNPYTLLPLQIFYNHGVWSSSFFGNN
jgi:Tol biopolymer transport system component